MREVDEHHKVTRELIEMSCPVVQEPLIGCTPSFLRSSYLVSITGTLNIVFCKLYVFAFSQALPLCNPLWQIGISGG